MIPSARIAQWRALILFPMTTAAVAFWAVWHAAFIAGQLGLALAWAALSLFTFLQLALAWTDRPALATGRQQQWLDGLFVTLNVPVYNEDQHMLRLAILSLFAQTRLPNRIQIVDDGSTQHDYREVRNEYRNLAAFYPQVEASWIRTRNRGKRHAQSVTFRDRGQADIFVTVDSDTILDRHAIEEGLKPFLDPRVTSVAGMLISYNASRNWLALLTDFWLVCVQVSIRSAWSRLGCVLVNSGCLAFYRADVIREALPSYLSETFFGRPVQFSDDSLLTLFAAICGRTVQQPTAFSFSVMPEKINHHFRQQLRWMRGSFIRSWWRFRYLPLSRISYWIHLLSWVVFAVNLTLFCEIFVEEPIVEHQLPPAPVNFFTLLLAYTIAIRVLTIQRSDASSFRQLVGVICAPLTALWVLLVLRPLRLYSMVTCRRTGWGTRKKIEVSMAAGAAAAVGEAYHTGPLAPVHPRSLVPVQTRSAGPRPRPHPTIISSGRGRLPTEGRPL